VVCMKLGNEKVEAEVALLADSLAHYADRGEAETDDPCLWSLFGVARDCAYKLRKQIVVLQEERARKTGFRPSPSILTSTKQEKEQ